jgi:hypothetical protein
MLNKNDVKEITKLSGYAIDKKLAELDMQISDLDGMSEEQIIDKLTGDQTGEGPELSYVPSALQEAQGSSLGTHHSAESLDDLLELLNDGTSIVIGETVLIADGQYSGTIVSYGKHDWATTTTDGTPYAAGCVHIILKSLDKKKELKPNGRENKGKKSVAVTLTITDPTFWDDLRTSGNFKIGDTFGFEVFKKAPDKKQRIYNGYTVLL